ncbi:MAG: M13 family metallopeptidase [Clostridiaceae bacterium]|nr:M13 family metallopeptidase [Clostridiaceae bacterium]
MHIRKIAALWLGMALLVTGCSVSAIRPTQTTRVNITPITSIRAEDDFYGFVNLEALQNTTLEYGETQAGAFTEIDIIGQLSDSVAKVVNGTEEYPEGSCEQIIRDAYLQYLEFQADDTAQDQACTEIEAELKKISDVRTMDELISIAEELKMDYGVSTFSNLIVDADIFNPDQYGILWEQVTEVCGIPLQKINDDPYLAKDYEKRIIDTLQVMGKSYGESKKIAQDLIRLIIDIAWATDYEISNSADPFSYFSLLSEAELDAALPRLGRQNFERMDGMDSNPYGGWLVMDKGQLTAFDALYQEENLEELKAWAAYYLLAQYGGFIASEYPIYEEYFPQSYDTLALQALRYINHSFPLVLSDLYVKDYYTEETDQKFSRMCEDIRESYRDLIRNSEWLSPEARQLLLQKLENIRFVSGGFCLEQMKDDPGINDLFGDHLFDTQRNVAKNTVAQSIEKIGQPRNRMQLGMPMHMVNACYDTDNTVTITVAIMAAPFFDVNADYYTNLGGLGAVVAHEVGHAFDANIIKYNAEGVYDPAWLPATDRTALEERNRVAVEYFENYFTVFDVYRVDGQLTLGENYADLGAMECITNIARTKDDYTKLFENYARIWSTLILNTDVISQLSEDPHSPATIRVNAILATTEDFYDVYGLKEGDGMYIAPENRISRWK